MRGGLLGLIEPIAPQPIGLAGSQESFSPTFFWNKGLEVRPVLLQQIQVDLKLDGNISFQQPIDNTSVIHKLKKTLVSLKNKSIRIILALLPKINVPLHFIYPPVKTPHSVFIEVKILE